MTDVAPKAKRTLKGVAPKPKLRRIGHITIRLSLEERAQLNERAERAGLMIGSYVRQVVFGAATPRQVRRPMVERKELVRILGQLGHVGGNLNQLAYHANAGMPVTKRDIDAALADLRDVRDAILMALGREP